MNKEIIDYVLYSDTDSLYIDLGSFMINNIGKEKWSLLPDEQKIEIIKQINSVIETHVNNKIYKDVQRKQYNSTETEFRVSFKQEIIAKSILFIKKKKYSSWIVNEEGVDCDKIKTTGLEIVRSDTPEIVRPMLKEIMSMILKGASDKDLAARIESCKKELMDAPPEGISTNVGIHDTKKYMGVDNKCKKGTPMHVKGVANYRNLLHSLKLEGKYEDIAEGTKAKIVYVKKNSFGFDAIAFTRWPVEFDKILQIDHQKQIEKVFTHKIEGLLEVMNKLGLLHSAAKSNIGLFFR